MKDPQVPPKPIKRGKFRNRRLHMKSTLTMKYEAPVSVIGELLVQCDLKIGAYTYLRGGEINRTEKIGRYCSIAPGLLISPPPHPLTWLSSSPFQYSRRKFIFYEPFSKTDIRQRNKENDAGYRRPLAVIGNDVWIGANVTINESVKLGDGCVVAAGAVVTHDVPPYAIVGGVPAKVIRYRFDQSVIDRLVETRWWQYDAADLHNVRFEDPLQALDDIEVLVKRGELVARPVKYQIYKNPNPI